MNATKAASRVTRSGSKYLRPDGDNCSRTPPRLGRQERVGVSGHTMLRNLHEDQRVALTQRELNGILLAHERYLSFRQGTRALLSRANLDALNLANRNLTEADFSGAS